MPLLGEILLERKTVTPQQLDLALQEQKRTGELMGDVLIRLGLISRPDLAQAIAVASDVKYVDLRQTIIETEAVQQVDKETAKRFKLIPFALEGDTIMVAMDNPNDVVAIDALRSSTGKNIEMFATDLGGVHDAIEMHYEVGVTLEEEIDNNIEAAMTGSTVPGEIATPVVRLVELFFIRAIRDHSTDIHITPEERASRVSYRIDGIMQSGTILPKQLHLPIVNRIKIMSGTDISEQRMPQEGGITFEFFDRNVNIRSSTSPCRHGENVVLRILDKASVVLRLEYLGLKEDHRLRVQRIVRRPHGIVLASGPTGSGKTTTLYSMLQEINALEKNILTIEDPIEYSLPLIKQTQVNESAGLTFSVALRHFLRQDPDILLVGEIRDLETAKIATQAALTGHLVLSTIHTNDAASSIPRLFELGISSYLIPATLRAVIAQRLVRTICPHCREEYVPTPHELSLYDMEKWGREHQVLTRGTCCKKCHFTGYTGRTGIFEILEISPQISELIGAESSSDIIMEEAKKEGMRTMRDDGLDKVLRGITTLEEVLRLT